MHIDVPSLEDDPVFRLYPAESQPDSPSESIEPVSTPPQGDYMFLDVPSPSLEDGSVLRRHRVVPQSDLSSDDGEPVPAT